MRISDQFPSKYLRAADLDGREVTVTMAGVKMEPVVQGEPDKLILYFKGKEKGVVLNKTNATAISNLYGDDTDEWEGEDITLFPAMVSFQGNTVPAIRVKPPRKSGAKKGQQTAPPPADDDEIPF